MPHTSPFFQAEVGLTETRAADVAADVVITPFAKWCQRQPPGSNLCWAAVSRAMLGFARGAEMTFAEICAAVRVPPLSPDEPFYVDTALTRLGVTNLAVVDLLKNGAQIAPQAINAGTPVAATIAWKLNNGFASTTHFIAIFGWIPARQSLVIFDPNTVGTSDDIIKEVPIVAMSKYLEGSESKTYGTWTDGYVVSRAG